LPEIDEDGLYGYSVLIMNTKYTKYPLPQSATARDEAGGSNASQGTTDSLGAVGEDSERSAPSKPRSNRPGPSLFVWILLLAWLFLVVVRGLMGGGFTERPLIGLGRGRMVDEL